MTRRKVLGDDARLVHQQVDDLLDGEDSTLSAILPGGVGLDGPADDFSARRNRLDAERAMDDVLADSFPASDPPSWNPGVSRPQSVVTVDHGAASMRAKQSFSPF